MTSLKRIVLMFLSVMLIVVFVSCSSAGEPPVSEPPVSEPPANPVTEPNDSGSTDLSKIDGSLRMTTTALSSNGQIIGSAMSSIVSEHLPNLKTAIIISSGSGENAHILHDKDAELAIMTPDVAYLSRSGIEPYDNVNDMYAICKTFTNQTIFCVRKDSGITKMEELEGKRVAVGAVGSGPYELAKAVLDSGYGIWDKIDKLTIATSDSPDALKDGTVDAMVAHLSSGFPAAYLSELDATNVELYYIGVSDDAMAKIQEDLPFEIATQLKSGDSRLTKLDHDLTSMSNTQFIAVRPDVSEDLVYAFTKVLFENAEELDAYHALGATIRKENALEGLDPGLSIHPGAARYYKEAGVWDDNFTIGAIK
mgnify:FL=1